MQSGNYPACALDYGLKTTLYSPHLVFCCSSSFGIGRLCNGSCYIFCCCPCSSSSGSRFTISLPMQWAWGDCATAGKSGTPTSAPLFLPRAIRYFPRLRLLPRLAGSSAFRKIQLRELAVKSELTALKAQLNPHFLYNVFNTISASVPPEQERTRELLAELADLFRYQLQASRSDEATVRGRNRLRSPVLRPRKSPLRRSAARPASTWMTTHSIACCRPCYSSP